MNSHAYFPLGNFLGQRVSFSSSVDDLDATIAFFCVAFPLLAWRSSSLPVRASSVMYVKRCEGRAYSSKSLSLSLDGPGSPLHPHPCHSRSSDRLPGLRASSPIDGKDLRRGVTRKSTRRTTALRGRVSITGNCLLSTLGRYSFVTLTPAMFSCRETSKN